MAQLDPIQRSSHQAPKTPKTSISPTFEQLLQQGDSPDWQSNTSPSVAKNNVPEECLTPQNKKSVFSKVKEKAKKLRHTLSGRKKNDPDGTTRSWGVILDDEEEDDENPEYLGAPMYESEMAPENYKEHARQNPRAVPVVPEKHAAPSSVKHEHEEKHNPANKTITETVTEKLAPTYTAVSDATRTIASKVVNLTIANPEDQQNHTGPSAPSSTEPDAQHSAANGVKNLDRSSESKEGATSSPQKRDKGVSVTEYFMNKLEPGEDERALSEVISDAISPRKNAGDMGVAEKVRAAVTSFLRTESEEKSMSADIPSQSKETRTSVNAPSQFTSKETSSSVSIPSQSKETSTSENSPSSSSPKLLRQKSIHCTTANLSSDNPIRSRVNTSPPIAISINAQEVTDDLNQGRILQAN